MRAVCAVSEKKLLFGLRKRYNVVGRYIMKVVQASFKIVQITPQALELIESAGRTCYKSESRGSPEDFVRKIISNGHHSVLEHSCMTVRFIIDRGVSHELVRHRLCAFSQESTRYCNYGKDRFGKEITVIKPFFWDADSTEYRLWYNACRRAEDAYFSLFYFGASPQEARSVLPNSLKTEIIVTANLREWRHIFDLRCAPAAHPQMREVMIPLHQEVHKLMPAIFDGSDTPRED